MRTFRAERHMGRVEWVTCQVPARWAAVGMGMDDGPVEDGVRRVIGSELDAVAGGEVAIVLLIVGWRLLFW
jgi:hypothetical protein